MSPSEPLTSHLFSEARCPPKGRANSPRGRTALRVLRVLNGEFPAPMQPKAIAKLAKVEYEACKKWLQRATDLHVVNTGNGWYRARATLHLLKKIGFQPLHVHNLKVRVPPIIKSLAGGLTPSTGRLEGLGRVDKRDPNTRHADWNGLPLTIQGMKDGGQYLHLRCSEEALAPVDVLAFSAWLEGMVHPSKPMLEQVDFNIDAAGHRLKLAGVQSIQLGNWTAAYVKAYNKDVLDVARIEMCYHRLDAPFHEMARVLHEVTQPPSAHDWGYRPELLPPPNPWEVA